jgi:hypothetical protein
MRRPWDTAWLGAGEGYSATYETTPQRWHLWPGYGGHGSLGVTAVPNFIQEASLKRLTRVASQRTSIRCREGGEGQCRGKLASLLAQLSEVHEFLTWRSYRKDKVFAERKTRAKAEIEKVGPPYSAVLPQPPVHFQAQPKSVLGSRDIEVRHADAWRSGKASSRAPPQRRRP